MHLLCGTCASVSRLACLSWCTWSFPAASPSALGQLIFSYYTLVFAIDAWAKHEVFVFSCMLSCLLVGVRGVEALGFVVILLLFSYASSFNAICFCFVVMVRLHCVLRRISLPCRASWMVCMVYFGLPSAVDACSWRLAWPKQEQNMLSVNVLACSEASFGAP